MKKATTTVILLLQLCYHAYSQDEITFKVRYKDSTRYNIIVDKAWHSETNYFGPDDFLLKLKKEGKDNPAYADEQFTTKVKLRTGSFTDSVNYPLTLELVNIADNIKELGIPNGTLVHGHGSLDSVPSFDSIPLSVTGDHKGGFRLAKTIFLIDTLAVKKLRQGEEFSLTSVNSHRVDRSVLDLIVTSTYAFNSIADGIANIDITRIYSARPGEGQYDFKAEGKGSGEIRYDIVNNVYVEYQDDIEISITENLYNGRGMEYKETGHYKRTVEIATD